MERRYYVYVLIDPRTNQPFYVGKGTGQRMWVHKSDSLLQCPDGTYKHNKPHNELIREIVAEGYDLVYEKVLFNVTEQEALRHEGKLVDRFGRKNTGTGILLNITPGGTQGGKTCKPVTQFTVDGEFIADHESAKQAGIDTGACGSYITQCCKGRRVSAGGYLWAYKGEEPKRPTKQYWRKVQQYLNGILMAEYKSLTEAESITGVGLRNISSCCNGKSKTAGGYVWKYSDGC